MAIELLNPYLNFNGDAKQAIELYERALGAKTERLMRFGDVPDMNPAPEHHDRIMHATLRVDDGVIMISDTMPGQELTNDGAKVQVCLHFTDVAEMARKFDALSAGGKVDHPLHDAFWGAKFGQLTDRFGVQWLFHQGEIPKTQKASRKIFVNLAVRNLKQSMAFFSKLGFEFNPQFTDEKAACMIVSDDASVMLLEEPFFKTFTKRALCDTSKHTEGLFALSCDSRAAVDAMVNQAIAAGGKHAMDPMDHGFMYGWSFYDLDGHHWEVMWMDPKGMQQQ